jgi:hypothetical protein
MVTESREKGLGFFADSGMLRIRWTIEEPLISQNIVPTLANAGQLFDPHRIIIS